VINRSAASDDNGWQPPILQTVAVDGSGVPQVLRAIEAHRDHLSATGLLAVREHRRVKTELLSVLQRQLLDRLVGEVGEASIDAWVERIVDREADTYAAARALCQAVAMTPPVEA
jgi:LAO/AO transport system kinase